MSAGENKKIKIGITMGDVNGIGPELILKTFEDLSITQFFTPVIYGSGKALYFYKQLLGYKNFNYKSIQSPDQAQENKVNFIECAHQLDKVKVGFPTPESGMAAINALKKATNDLLSEKIDLIVTLPIHKTNVQSDEFNFPGHTEFFSHKCEQPRYLMLMVHEEISLRVAVATAHIPLHKVPATISTELIFDKLELLNLTLKIDFSIERPKIAILGLNPHAGDQGLLGNEEIDIIQPAIQKAMDNNIIAMGPYPADGFFAKGLWRKFDAILAMYHDQGLIPFKTLSQGDGVNFTAGLPIIRTSPDHGTAFDIAGKNIAETNSFTNAIFLAIDILKKRTENVQLIENKLQPIVPKELQATDENITPE